MATNYIAPGNSIDFTAATTLTSGQGLLLGDGSFIVTGSAAVSGDLLTGHVMGIFNLPKAAVAVVPGDKAYWDDTAKVMTDVSAGNTLRGVFTETVGTGVLFCDVRLSGAPV
jgi:predicted RecA/RadA family phage recombinase